MPSDVEWLTATPLRHIAPAMAYPGYMAGFPDMWALRLPPVLWRGDTPPTLNDKYKILFAENDAERREVEDALEMPMRLWMGMLHYPLPIRNLMGRPSTQPLGGGSFALYVPPNPGGPFLVVGTLPKNTPDAGMARQRYGYDAFETEEAARDHMTEGAVPIAMAGVRVEIRVPDLAGQS